MTGNIATRRYRPSRKADIIGAALEEIAANGYADTTLAAVAHRAGITTTAVYYHFESKLVLLLDLVSRIAEEIMSVLPEDGDEPVRVGDGFVAMFDAFATWLDHHPLKARLYFLRAAGVTPQVEQRRREWTNQVALAASERVLAVNPDLGVLTARIIGLALPTLFEEYAAMCLSDGEGPLSSGRARALRSAVVELGSRLNQFSVPHSPVILEEP